MFTPRWYLLTESMLVNVFAEETFPVLANFRQIFVVSHFQNCKPKYLSQKKNILEVHLEDRNIPHNLWIHQPDRCPAALQTKNPSEAHWGQLIKSQLAYKQTKTWRRGWTKFTKQSTHGNYLLSVPITFGEVRKCMQGLTQVHWGWGGMGFIPFCFCGSAPSDCVFAGYMPSEGGSAGWWPLDLN